MATHSLQIHLDYLAKNSSECHKYLVKYPRAFIIHFHIHYGHANGSASASLYQIDYVSCS